MKHKKRITWKLNNTLLKNIYGSMMKSKRILKIACTPKFRVNINKYCSPTPNTFLVRTCNNSYYCNVSFESHTLSSWGKKKHQKLSHPYGTAIIQEWSMAGNGIRRAGKYRAGLHGQQKSPQKIGIQKNLFSYLIVFLLFFFFF